MSSLPAGYVRAVRVRLTVNFRFAPQPPRANHMTPRRFSIGTITLDEAGPHADGHWYCCFCSTNRKLHARQRKVEGSFHHGFWTRSEEHTSELQSHSFISYAVFC